MLLLLPHSPVYGLNWLLLYSWQPEPDNRKPRVARYSPSLANQERQTGQCRQIYPARYL